MSNEDAVKELANLIKQYIEQGNYRYVMPDTPTNQRAQIIIDLDCSSIPETIPMPCRCCSNHPSNGGSGICHCILGGLDNVVY